MWLVAAAGHILRSTVVAVYIVAHSAPQKVHRSGFGRFQWRLGGDCILTYRFACQMGNGMALGFVNGRIRERNV
uniref:Putative secreted protein n=1 Tax=Anopheles darlingi TaxID=43151 RepID=A0A2M4DB32_ANODA